MKLLIAILFCISACSCLNIKAHFVVNTTTAGYSFEGHAYVVTKEDEFETASDIVVPYNGTFRMKDHKEYFASGTVSVKNPPFSHLNDIKVIGIVKSPGKLTFSGIFKVNPLDVYKPKIPIKGELSLSNGVKDKANGYVDRPVILELD